MQASFKYVAVDTAGARRRGALVAADRADALRRLEADGLTPVSVAQQREQGPMFSWQRANSNDVSELTRELAVLVEARIPLARGLMSIAESEEKADVARIIRDVASSIEAGSPMTTALEKHRDLFGSVYIETLRAAEKSGNLVAVMRHLADLLERQRESRQMLRRAMAYPSIVLAVVFLALTVIVVFVVPKFAATFAAQGVDMPLLTRLLQAAGESVKAWWYLYAGGLLAAFLGLVGAWRSPPGRIVLERLLLRIPVLGEIIRAVTAARFVRVFGIGLASGLDLIESLSMGGRATGRPVFVRECRDMAERMRSGAKLEEVLRITGYLPPFARRMLSAGKDSAELARACDIVAAHYEQQASHKTKNINTVIEPLLTVAMASIVLITALAVFLPMWQMIRLQR